MVSDHLVHTVVDAIDDVVFNLTEEAKKLETKVSMERTDNSSTDNLNGYHHSINGSGSAWQPSSPTSSGGSKDLAFRQTEGLLDPRKESVFLDFETSV